MKQIILFILFAFLLFSCSEKFDNPLDPLADDPPSFFFQIIQNDTTFIDSSLTLQDNRDPIKIVYGVIDERETDVTIEVSLKNRYNVMNNYSWSFDVQNDELSDTLEFEPPFESYFKLFFHAYDDYENEIIDSLEILIDESGITGADISAVVNDDSTDIDIVFNSICGIAFDSLKTIDTLDIKLQNIQGRSQRNRDDWISYQTLNYEFDEENNRIILHDVPFVSQNRDNEIKMKYTLMDNLGRTFSDSTCSYLYEEDPQDLDITFLSDEQKFNPNFPLKFKTNFVPNLDSLQITFKGDFPETTIESHEITPYIYLINDYSLLEENETYSLTFYYNNEIVYEDSIEYDTTPAQITQNITEFTYEDSLQCEIKFDENIGSYEIFQDSDLIVAETQYDSDAIDFDLIFAEEGEYDLQIDFFDVVGNFASHSQTIEYQTGLEILNIDPPEDSYLNQDTVFVTVEYNLPLNQDSSKVFVEEIEITDIVFNDDNNLTFEYIFTEEKEYNFRADLHSESGIPQEKEWKYTYDSMPPEIVLLDPPDNTVIDSANIVIDVEFNEIIQDYELRCNNETINENPAFNDSTIQISYVFQEMGENNFNLKYHDLAGNENTTDFTYTFEPPVLELIDLSPPEDSLITVDSFEVNMKFSNLLEDSCSVINAQDSVSVDPEEVQDSTLTFVVNYEGNSQTLEINLQIEVMDIYSQEITEYLQYSYEGTTNPPLELTYLSPPEDSLITETPFTVEAKFSNELDEENSSIQYDPSIIEITNDNFQDSILTFDVTYTGTAGSDDLAIELDIQDIFEQSYTDTLNYFYDPEPDTVSINYELMTDTLHVMLEFTELIDSCHIDVYYSINQETIIDTTGLNSDLLSFDYQLDECGEYNFNMWITDQTGNLNEIQFEYIYEEPAFRTRERR